MNRQQRKDGLTYIFMTKFFVKKKNYLEVGLSILGHLTHLSLESLLWDTGKQYSLRCDAAEAPKNESGLTQMIMIGESIHQIWVNNESDMLMIKLSYHINPLMMSRFTYHYHLDESTFILRRIRNDFLFSLHF